MHEHNESCNGLHVGAVDLNAVLLKVRDGAAWKKLLELGMVEEHGDSWRLLEPGAPMVLLGMMLATEMVENDLQGEEKQKWMEEMMQSMGVTLMSMTARGLMQEEIMQSLQEMEEEQGGPWVKLD